MTRRAVAVAAKFTHADGNKLLGRLNASQVRALLERVRPGSSAVQRGATTVLTNCLTHPRPDVNPSMYINTSRGTIKCMSCGYFTRNILQLFRDAFGWSSQETLGHVLAATGVKLITDKVEPEVEKYEDHVLALSTMSWVCNTYLQRILAPPTEGPDAANYDPISLHGTAETLHWLFQQRGHLPEAVPYLPYGVWPPLHLMLSYCEDRLQEIAGADYTKYQNTSLTPERRERVINRVKELAGTIGQEWTYCVAFTTGHAVNTPARIRIRRPHAQDTKDNNFTEVPGFTPDEPVGYFGLYTPALASYRRDDLKAIRFVLVEGENDALSPMERRVLSREALGTVYISSGGSVENSVDALADAGIEKLYVLSDHPSLGNGEDWLRQRLLTASDVDVHVFQGWPQLSGNNGLVKDPDDVIALIGWEHFDLVTRDPRLFVPVNVWASQRAIETADDLPKDDVRARTAVAVRFGTCVRNSAELSAYVNAVTVALGISPSSVRDGIVRGKDDEAGFVGRVVDAFRRDFCLLYKEDSQRGPVLFSYHRAKQTRVRLAVNDGEGMLMALANVVGDLHEYFKEHVGLPTWVLAGAGGLQTMFPIADVQKKMASYLKIAMQELLRDVPDRQDCKVLGVGVHVIEDSSVPRGFVQYANNGTAVYRGTYPDDGREIIEWKQMDGPADGQYLFALEPYPTCPDIQSVEDLQAGNEITLEEVKRAVFTLRDAIHSAWKLQFQEVDPTFLAYSLLMYSSPHFCPSGTHIELVGPPSSGKSTLLSLFSGSQYPHLVLCAWTRPLLNYTLASIYQMYDRTAIALCPDEYTKDFTQMTQKGSQIQSINELLRQVIFPGGSVVTRGGNNGQSATTRVVKANVVTASIHPATDAQDASRRFTIETVKAEGHQDPSITLFDHIKPDEYRRIRRVFALGMFKFLAKYRETFAKVEPELATGKVVTSFAVDTRFLRNFYPMAPMMEMFGEDWRTYVNQTAITRQEKLAANARNNLTNQLFDGLGRTSNVRVGQQMTSVSALLSGKDNRWISLNTSLCGVYYMDAEELLIIDWVGATSPGGVLYRVEPYSRTPQHLLKHQLDQHSLGVRSRDLPKEKIKDLLQSFSIYIRVEDLTVLNVSEMVQELRAKAKDFGPPPGAAGGGPAVPMGDLPESLKRQAQAATSEEFPKL